MNRRRLMRLTGGLVLGTAASAAGLPRAPERADAESFLRRMFVPGLAADGEPEPRPTLRQVADQVPFRLGTQAAYLFAGGPSVQQQIPRHFNMLGLELYMQFPPNPGIHPQRDTYLFNWPDFVVGWAASKGMTVHGGNLAWGTNAGYTRFTPDWVKTAPTRNDAIAILTEWVSALVARYPQVLTWTIVNEPWSHGSRDIWREKIGDDYPFVAAKAARSANPNAALILNDYDNHLATPTADSNLDLASRMVAEGLLDGVGFQMHLDAKSPDSLKKDDVKRNLARFAKLKGGAFKLMVTEFDVNLHGYPGTTAERWVHQARIYQAMLEALLESGGTEFAIMGNTDELSWLTGLPTGGVDSEGTPFMADWTPKPAYAAIYDVLRRRSN